MKYILTYTSVGGKKICNQKDNLAECLGCSLVFMQKGLGITNISGLLLIAKLFNAFITMCSEDMLRFFFFHFS